MTTYTRIPQLNGAATVRAPGFKRFSNQRLPQTGAERFTQSDSLPRGLTQVLETLPSSAVMEERSRLAREIHDAKTHVKSLLETLGAVGRTAAVRQAVHRGLVKLN